MKKNIFNQGEMGIIDQQKIEDLKNLLEKKQEANEKDEKEDKKTEYNPRDTGLY